MEHNRSGNSFRTNTEYLFLEAENDQIFVLKYVLYFHSVVLLWRGGLLRLHHHPAHPADRLCSFLEPVLAGEGRKRKPQVLVWR